MTTATSLWMAATIGIGAGAGQFKLVLAGSAAAILVLSGLALLERFIPKRPKADAGDEHPVMPNRRGSGEN
jgi:putative Mg2+ transporter-C (MgtC) family protein